jgi:1,4-alpha-glucan branching enzyme
MSHQLPNIVKNDPWLQPFVSIISERHAKVEQRLKKLCKGKDLSDFAVGHLYYGLHRTKHGWMFREWAPNAKMIYLVGDFSGWRIEQEFALCPLQHGNWEILLPHDRLKHGQKYKLFIKWNGGEAYRLPSYGNRMVQNDDTKVFDAEIWSPQKPYHWRNEDFKPDFTTPLVYEAHVGMSSEDEMVTSFKEFTINMLPRIKKAGYNTVQLMAIQEHPYYGSFGYHVSNLFAVSSRFGTPDDLKELVDAAHGMGLAVVMDLIHSHAVRNEMEGLGAFDGTEYQYFHTGLRRIHAAWDSLCYNYSKDEVLHFLLSNCQYWLHEYRFDGFRFDGVTSMLYIDHGLGKDFTNYNMYYDGNQDEDAIVYLALANKLIHQTHPHAITIAEEMSGMPGLAAPLEEGGYGFDFRLAMGIPDYWIKVIKEIPDEAWDVGNIYYELNSRRVDEKTISYAESHDQALVGDQTLFFRLTKDDIYTSMNKDSDSLVIERAIALHKIIRLLTLTTAGSGYLNFMGNEFGHPEWIDFPRKDNDWSYKYARRQWNLQENRFLKYHWLSDFDKTLIQFAQESKIFSEKFTTQRFSDTPKQVLVYSRKNYLFAYNLNFSQSFTNFQVAVEPGTYKVLFTTDDKEYGGHGRVDKFIEHHTVGKTNGFGLQTLHLYLPTRTGIVLVNRHG